MNPMSMAMNLMPPHEPTLKERLAAWQTANKLSPTAAAARCGLSLATWTRLIAGGNASQQSLAGIERALGERI